MSETTKENPWIDIAPGIRRRTVTHGTSMYQMLAKLDALAAACPSISIRRSRSCTSSKAG